MQNLFVNDNDEFKVGFVVATDKMGVIFCDITEEALKQGMSGLSKWEECEDMVNGASCCSDCCSKQYFNGNEIDYNCEQKRKVYVLRYVASTAERLIISLTFF